jgi:plasmid replication initiation protein
MQVSVKVRKGSQNKKRRRIRAFQFCIDEIETPSNKMKNKSRVQELGSNAPPQMAAFG